MPTQRELKQWRQRRKKFLKALRRLLDTHGIVLMPSKRGDYPPMVRPVVGTVKMQVLSVDGEKVRTHVLEVSGRERFGL